MLIIVEDSGFACLNYNVVGIIHQGKNFITGSQWSVGRVWPPVLCCSSWQVKKNLGSVGQLEI